MTRRGIPTLGRHVWFAEETRVLTMWWLIATDPKDLKQAIWRAPLESPGKENRGYAAMDNCSDMSKQGEPGTNKGPMFVVRRISVRSRLSPPKHRPCLGATWLALWI
jgi:hypothetical protein